MRYLSPIKSAILGSLLVLSGSFVTTGPKLMAQEITFKDQQAFEEAVRSYLIQNPSVVIEAIEEYRRIQTVSNKLPRINIYRGFLEDGVRHASLGNPDGDVVVLEFFDYRCHYCRKHFPEVQAMIAANKNVRFVPLPFPILDREGAKQNSRLTALAGLAAHKQGKFVEFHTAMMTSPEKPTEEIAYQIAAQVGLNVEQLKADMRDKLVLKHLTNLLAIGRDIGWSGTPAYVIGDDIVEGAAGIGRMQAAIDRAESKLAKSGKRKADLSGR